MITIFVRTYNSETTLPFFIKFYRTRFNNCQIVIYDNESIDNTISIAKKFDCEVHTYCTNGILDLNAGRNIKNKCWKEAKTDWVLVCDADEMLDINQEQLQKENELGTTIISSEGYQMVNMVDNLDLDNICYGYRDSIYDKIILFNKQKISEMNYTVGCHICSPTGEIKYSHSKYRMYHYHFLNPDFISVKYKEALSRLSKESIKNGFCSHYMNNDIVGLFNCVRSSSVKIL